MNRVLILGLSVAFLCAACSRKSPPETSGATTPTDTPTTAAVLEAATISASPNPILQGPASGKTTITWDTHGAGSGEVYVNRNGDPERLFAKGPKGSEVADWVQPGASYDFILYDGMSHKPLAKVQVSHQP